MRTYPYVIGAIIALSLFIGYLIRDNYRMQSQLGTLNSEMDDMSKKSAAQNQQTDTPITNFRFAAAMYYNAQNIKGGQKYSPNALPGNGVWHVTLLHKYMSDDANGVPHFWGMFGKVQDDPNIKNGLLITNVFLMKLEDADGGDKGNGDYLMDWYYCLEDNDKIILTIKGDDITIHKE